MHRSASLPVLSAVAIAAALGLSGCGRDVEIPPASPVTLSPVTPATALDIPLPAPDVLVDVMVRLTDPNVSAAEKVALVESTSPDDAAAIERFDKAVSDGSYRPLSFEANDLQWSGGNVMANVVIRTANPRVGGDVTFAFPLEFAPNGPGWQLTRDSAEQLLQYGDPAPSPGPPPPPPGP